MTPSHIKMKEILSSAGFDLSRQQTEQLWNFYKLLVEHNEEYDLTRIVKFEDIIVKHFVDCLFVSRLVDLPATLLDIGTGAGFPGIPLKIIKPDLLLTLSEPKKKRVQFLEMALEELGITDVTVFPHMVTDKAFFEVEGVITRALETAESTLARTAHFLPENGRVILMKGPEADTDLDGLSEPIRRQYALELDRRYSLPGTKHKRRLIVFRKTADSLVRTYTIPRDVTETAPHLITSKDNGRFKEIRSLLSPDGIKKTGHALVFGKKTVKDVLNAKKAEPRELIISDGYAESDPAFLEIFRDFESSGRLLTLKKSLFAEIDPFQTHAPVLRVSAPEIRPWNRTLQPGCTLIVPFQDPENVGTVIRSAVAFGIRRIVLLLEAAHPLLPKAVRASSGAVFNAELFRGPSLRDLASLTRSEGLVLIALDKRGASLQNYPFPDAFALLPGMEGPGLPDEFIERAVSIPVSPDIESLNASIAASIVMFEWKNRSESQQ